MDAQDLDVLVPEPKRVKLGGVEYELPPDLPMEIFLRMNLAASKRNDDGTEDMPGQIQSLVDAISDLFIWQMEEKGATPEQLQQVKDQVHKLVMRRGTRYTFSLIQNIYKADDERADEAAAVSDPTTAQVPPAEA